MALTMESEMNGFLATSERIAKGEPLEGLDELDFALFQFPGFFSREVRIYSNIAVEMNDMFLSEGRYVVPEHIQNPSLSNYLTGKSGVIAIMMLPNYVRAEAQIGLIRAKVTGIALATGVIAYRADQGKLPTDFEQVRAIGIPVPEQAVIDELGVKYEDGVISVPFDGSHIEGVTTNYFLYGERPWYQIQDNVITLRP